MAKVLLTGFEPYWDYPVNSSWVVAEMVAARGVVGVDIVIEQVPVSFSRVHVALREAVEKHSPNMLIMLGQSGGSDKVKLDGYIPNEEPINIETPAALFTNIPIKSLRAAIEEQGISVKISNSCGLYVCNRLYYEALMLCKKYHMKSIFIHLPFYEGQPSAKPNKPTMPQNDMVKAIQTIIEKINDKYREF